MNTDQALTILGLGHDASREEAKARYRAQVKVCHPDLYNHDEVLRQQAEAEMKLVNQAYRTVCQILPSRPGPIAKTAPAASKTVQEPEAETGPEEPASSAAPPGESADSAMGQNDTPAQDTAGKSDSGTGTGEESVLSRASAWFRRVFQVRPDRHRGNDAGLRQGAAAGTRPSPGRPRRSFDSVLRAASSPGRKQTPSRSKPACRPGRRVPVDAAGTYMAYMTLRRNRFKRRTRESGPIEKVRPVSRVSKISGRG